MGKLFSYDNPIWRFMGRVADVFVLTVLWALCSLPVLTMGASTSALYYVTLKMARGHEGYLIKSYMKAFRDNFKQATILWMLILAVGLFLGVDMYWLHGQESQLAAFLFWLCFTLVILYLFVTVMILPLQSRLEAGMSKLLFLSFMVSVKNFSWVLFMLVIAGCIVAMGIFVFWPILFVGAGTIAYIHALILEWVVFPKYGWSEAKEE